MEKGLEKHGMKMVLGVGRHYFDEYVLKLYYNSLTVSYFKKFVFVLSVFVRECVFALIIFYISVP